MIFYFHSVLTKQNPDTVLGALENTDTIKVFLQECLTEYFPSMGEKIFSFSLILQSRLSIY